MSTIQVLTLNVTDTAYGYESNNSYVIAITSTVEKAEEEKSKFINICEEYGFLTKQHHINMDKFYFRFGDITDFDIFSEDERKEKEEISKPCKDFEKKNFSYFEDKKFPFSQGAITSIQEVYGDGMDKRLYEIKIEIQEREIL